MTKWLYTAILYLLIYFFIELGFYLSYCFNWLSKVEFFEAINQPNNEYDPVRGFRFLLGNSRTILAIKNQIEFDNSFHINNKGIPTDIDYSESKNDSTVFRYLVFGDSFTQGYFLSENWPQKAQKESNANNINVQHYNFSFDGGGICNWQNVYFNECILSYVCDGIILASFGDDLNRDFWVMNPDYENNQMCTAFIPYVPFTFYDVSGVFNLPCGEPLYKQNYEIDSIYKALSNDEF